MMKVSFGSWSFIFGPHAKSPVGFDESARRIADAGYDGIEISGFPPHVTLEDYPTPQSRRQLRQQLEDLGLAVSGYVPDLTMVNLVVEDNRARYLNCIRHYVEMCVDLGSPALRLDTIAAPGSIAESDYNEVTARIASVWREAAELAAAAKVKVLWEFEPGFIFNKPSEVVQLYERVGHRNFQILFDTCHAYLCSVTGARQEGEPETLNGGVVEFLEMLSGRIGHVHIVDTDGTLYGEETSSHLLFGQGLINFEKLAPKLKALPGIDWWCVDLAFRADTEQQLKPSLEYVRSLLR
jgi:sugar phosphate isomerase/epimerase